MSNSPYVPTEIKNYMRKFNIQEVINRSVNDLLKNTPQDPFSYLIGLFQQKCTPNIQILDISMSESVAGEGFSVISLRAKVNFFNQPHLFSLQQPLGISSDENNLFDPESKGMKLGIGFYNEKIRPIIKNKKFKCSQIEAVDSQLVKVYQSNEKKGLYQVNLISFSVQTIKSRMLCKPLYQIYSELVQRQIKSEEVPKLFINCLHGGKAIGSKCKVFKYYLISTTKEGLASLASVLQSIKKSITSGKGGEAALKLFSDGTFVCPLDTILDNLKIVEDAINASPVGKNHLKIGLSWQADTLFSADTKKYELQNPKTPFDNDQMIDYLVKLLIEKPLISYLEDPLASSELASWAKLIKKIKQTQAIKNVKIGARNGNLLNWFSADFQAKLNQVSIPLTADSHPQLNQQAREAKNSIKFPLNYFQIRLSQLQTVSAATKLIKILQKTKSQLILQDNAYQTYNTEIVDICFGIGASCNLGSLQKFDRICKVYRALDIVKERQEPL